MLQKKTITQKKSGFTMIELLAVVTIMAILFAIGIVSYTNASKNARNNRRRSDITNLRQALVLYRSDNGCYPRNLNDLIPDYWSDGSIPTDPSGSVAYSFSGVPITCPDGSTLGFRIFTLSANLETPPGGTFRVDNP